MCSTCTLITYYSTGAAVYQSFNTPIALSLIVKQVKVEKILTSLAFAPATTNHHSRTSRSARGAPPAPPHFHFPPGPAGRSKLGAAATVSMAAAVVDRPVLAFNGRRQESTGWLYWSSCSSVHPDAPQGHAPTSKLDRAVKINNQV